MWNVSNKAGQRPQGDMGAGRRLRSAGRSGGARENFWRSLSDLRKDVGVIPDDVGSMVAKPLNALSMKIVEADAAFRDQVDARSKRRVRPVFSGLIAPIRTHVLNR